MYQSYSTDDLYLQYKRQLSKIADIRYSAAVLQWDQETYLPPKGAAFRAQQLATLTEVAHELFTGEAMHDVLTELIGRELDSTQKRNVELTLYDYSRLKKLSSEFIRTLSEAVSASFYAWVEARKQNDFSVFLPYLAPLVELKRREADMLGYEGHPYNALLNEYERGTTVLTLDKVFADVTQPLLDLLGEVQRKQDVDDSFLHQHFPKSQQWEWGQYIAKQLGFDFNAGRQDISEHPFTTNFSNSDVRITTRIDEDDFENMTWSTLHEVGHAMYEQGLPESQYGMPLGEYASLSIHESQSRLWENCVGRSDEFWQYYFPRLQQYFPTQFKKISREQFVKAINKVQPSLIRTEADELTYHFHVMVRYELEKRLIAGDLPTKDIPAYWNELYSKLLNVKVPDDKQGCLQDVHWSHGSFGYFPTYSLGSFYAAQFWQQAKVEINNLEHNMALNGDTSELLKWLRSKVHPHGRFYKSDDLCKLVTGKGLDSSVFVQYLRNKLNVLL